jgi:Cu+-exporting ATPase
MTMIVAEDKKLNCAHCGEECIGQFPKTEQHSFCCNGCQIVWNLLHQNGLSEYYAIEEIPGLSFKEKESQYYDFLDDPKIVKDLIAFSSGYTKTVFINLPQIHCSSCIWLLERLHLLLPGVKNTRVNFLHKKATIVYDDREVSLREIAELLNKIGYSPGFEDRSKKNQDKSKDRSLIYKIGVAGFCFGNIMLLSFPDYLGMISSEFGKFFGFLNIALAIPVVAYSGADYLRSAFKSLRQNRIGIDVPIALGMLTLFLRSIYEILLIHGEGYLDSLAGFVFFLLIGKWIQQRTFSGIAFDRDYKSFFPISVKFWTGKNWINKSVGLLKKNDLIMIRNGEVIPCDGVVSRGTGSVDYSFVTGESDPVSLSEGMAVSSGGKLINSSFEVLVDKEVNQGQLTQLWNDDIFNKRDQDRESHFLNIIGKYFTIAILIIAMMSLTYWLLADVTVAFNSFTAVLIVACPCVLALSIPFLYGSALRRLSGLSIFGRNVFTLFDLDQIDSVIFDKTGTLTDTQKSEVQFIGDVLSEFDLSIIKSISQYSNHKLSQLIYDYTKESESFGVQDFVEFPGKGIQAKVWDTKVRIGSDQFIFGTTQNHSKQSTFVEIGGKIKGYFQFENTIRQGVEHLIKELVHSGYQLSVLSGDHSQDQEHITGLFPDKAEILFGQSPKDKLEFVRQEQAAGKKVMMIGDGLNDAGALKKSNIGIVISSNENNFTPASDVILKSDRLNQILLLLRYGKNLRYALYGAFLIAFLYNIIGLGFAVTGQLTPVVAAILMPLSSISIMLYGLCISWITLRLSGTHKILHD